MLKLWTQAGRLLRSAAGKILACNECPCDDDVRGCNACAGNRGPRRYRVDIANVPNAACAGGGNCKDIEGSWIVEFSHRVITETTSVCVYYLADAQTTCAASESLFLCEDIPAACGSICLRLFEFPGADAVTVQATLDKVSFDNFCDGYLWIKDSNQPEWEDGEIPCREFVNEAIFLNSPANGNCFSHSPTCHITAL